MALPFKTALLVVGWLCAAALAWPQATPPRTETSPRFLFIRGTVRLAENEAGVSSIKVDLKRFTGETVSTLFTRSNGDFEFGGLGRGSYILTIEAPGFEPVQEQIELASTSRSGVQLYLRKLPPQPGTREHSVSVREYTLPRKARDAFRKGIETSQQRRDPRASLPHFQRAVAEYPSYYEAYYQMGLIYLDLGEPQKAEEALRMSVALSKETFADPYFALASLHSTGGKHAEAERLCRQGLKIDDAWQGHFELARALFALDRVAEAEASIVAAKARRADYAPMYLLSANIHIRTKNYPALLEDLDAYLKLDPDGPVSAGARQMREQVARALQQQPAPKVPPPGM
jgi:hypothetical protein